MVRGIEALTESTVVNFEFNHLVSVLCYTWPPSVKSTFRISVAQCSTGASFGPRPPRRVEITQHCARCAFSGFEPKAQLAGSRHPLRSLLRLPVSTPSPCSTQLVRFVACTDSAYRYTTLCTTAPQHTRPQYPATENRTLPSLFPFPFVPSAHPSLPDQGTR